MDVDEMNSAVNWQQTSSIIAVRRQRRDQGNGEFIAPRIFCSEIEGENVNVRVLLLLLFYGCSVFYSRVIFDSILAAIRKL
jgi:hypothetical protein